MKIASLTAHGILDSHGNPALTVRVVLEDGMSNSASITLEVPNLLPQKDSANTLIKQQPVDESLQKDIEIVEKTIQPHIKGLECHNQQVIDSQLIKLDGTPTKSKLGKHVITAVSMAIAKTAASSQGWYLFQYIRNLINKNNIPIQLPVPQFTLIDDSLHTATTVDMEEFRVIPASFKKFHESLAVGVTMHTAVKEILLKENLSPMVGEKGGYCPLLSNNEDILSLLQQAAESVSLRSGYDIFFGIAANADLFYKDKHYKIKDRSMALSQNELTNYYAEICKKYHILYLEDPMQTADVDGWTNLFKQLNQQILLTGNKHTMTDPVKLHNAVEKKTINSIVISISQIGTTTEALAVAEMAKTAGLKVVVTGNVTETNEDFLADLAVAIDADYVAFGAPIRGERVAKYNRILEIERLLLTPVQQPISTFPTDIPNS